LSYTDKTWPWPITAINLESRLAGYTDDTNPVVTETTPAATDASVWVSRMDSTIRPRVSELITTGLTTVTAMHAGELRRHCAGAMVHVDYGNPTNPPFQ
jgi:hypothetical protein